MKNMKLHNVCFANQKWLVNSISEEEIGKAEMLIRVEGYI